MTKPMLKLYFSGRLSSMWSQPKLFCSSLPEGKVTSKMGMICRLSLHVAGSLIRLLISYSNFRSTVAGSSHLEVQRKLINVIPILLKKAINKSLPSQPEVRHRPEVASASLWWETALSSLVLCLNPQVFLFLIALVAMGQPPNLLELSND